MPSGHARCSASSRGTSSSPDASGPRASRRSVVAQRRLPVRPNLEQLRHQAKELLREIRRGDPVAVALLSMPPHDPADVKLAQAQMRWLAATASPGGCGWCSRSPHRRDLARRRRSSARALARASAALCTSPRRGCADSNWEPYRRLCAVCNCISAGPAVTRAPRGTYSDAGIRSSEQLFSRERATERSRRRGQLVQQKLTGVVASYRLKAADRGRIDRAVRRHRVLRER